MRPARPCAMADMCSRPRGHHRPRTRNTRERDRTRRRIPQSRHACIRRLRGSHQLDDSPLTLAAWKLAAPAQGVLLAERIVVTRIGIGLPHQVRGYGQRLSPYWVVRAERAGFSTLCTVGRCTYPGVMDTVALMAAAGVSVYRGRHGRDPVGLARVDRQRQPDHPGNGRPTTCMGSRVISWSSAVPRPDPGRAMIGSIGG